MAHVGGGIPSLEVAKSIATDVLSYGLWGRGYTEVDESTEREIDVPKLAVTLEDGQGEYNDTILVWLEGWRSPAAAIYAERRCVACHRSEWMRHHGP